MLKSSTLKCREQGIIGDSLFWLVEMTGIQPVST